MLIEAKIKKLINSITDYEIYWFAIEMNQTIGASINILSLPEHVRSEIINYLEFRKVSIDKADQIRRHMKIDRMIPFNSVRWFYKKNKETLLLAMFFYHTEERMTKRNIESQLDIELLSIEMIYSELILKDYEKGELAKEFAARKFEELKEMYNTSKTNRNSLRWLNKSNKDQIKWAYNYKPRANKSENDQLIKEVLVFTQFFNIDSDDTDLMYDHIIASLDYHVFIAAWKNNKTSQINKESIQKIEIERLNIIDKMRNAWHKKASQERKKEAGTRFKLSLEALTQLKELAKKEKISQDKLLEKIIADYHKENRFRGVL
ncbi:hypothetical protein [Psychrobacter ciconiae]|uniref:hypothetical protein n=1 Tax=Psychrobacter ciconiae TaxID=1553449 RepID=UPI001919D3FA|nr:hypothetical protein [Psychrobacter ciconiae]